MSVLLDDVLNRELLLDGFARFQALNADEINSLISIYNEETEEQFTGFHPTMFHKNKAYKVKMNDVILNALKPIMPQHLSSTHELLYGNFMVKEPDAGSIMKLHQDWTYVDENEHDSYAIWIPLLNLDEQNGAFSVIPKSHHLSNIIRGPGTTCPMLQMENELISRYGKPVYLQAGEAVIWNHRLGHYSPPNLSERPRMAITAILVPKNTQILHYYRVPSEATVTEYKVDGSFFLDNKIIEKPELPESRVLAENPLTLTIEEFEKLLA